MSSAPPRSSRASSVALLVLATLLAGCAHAAASPPPLPGQAPPSSDTSAPVRATGDAPVDDWTTFAHDAQRSGFQPQNVGIDASNVAALKPRWKYATGQDVGASPLVAGGRVYVAGRQGAVLALDAATGRQLWRIDAQGAEFAMTPTLADGLLFVGQHVEGGWFGALDAATGALKWRARLAGGVHSEPVVHDGTVYVGETTGDPPACHHAGVHAYDEHTGAEKWTVYVDPKEHDGGAVWAPISFAGDTLYFGTGNTCGTPGPPTGDAMLSVDLDGKTNWATQVANPLADDDFGGGALLMHGQAIAVNKDGRVYAFDAKTGRIVWTSPVAALDGYGGIATPSSDGRTIVVGDGFRHDPTKTKGPPGGLLVGMDTGGNVLWRRDTRFQIPGSVAIAHGIGYVALDDRFTALDVRTGKTLWSYPTAVASSYASPAVVPSGVYFAANDGTIFAFDAKER